MNESNLNSLLLISKKSDASNVKKEEFQKEMLFVLQEEGFSSNAERCLFDGFLLGSAIVFFDYLIGLEEDDRLVVYNKFTSSQPFNKNDKGISFKIMIYLFNRFMNYGQHDKAIIGDIIIRLNGLSKNKKNKRFGDLSKSLKLFFLSDISGTSNFPCLKDLNLKSEDLQGFINLMTEVLQELKNTDENNNKIIEELFNWLDSCDEADRLEKDSNMFRDNKKDQGNTLKPKKTSTFRDEMLKISNKIKEIANEKDGLFHKNEKLLDKVEKQKAEIDDLNRILSDKEQNIKKSNTRNEILNMEKSKLLEIIKKKEFEIEEKNTELKKMSSVLSVVEKEKDSSIQARLNSIASKLKPEFYDYKDAIGMEMTIDLGENMRNQLKVIFDILHKNGINIKGR